MKKLLFSVLLFMTCFLACPITASAQTVAIHNEGADWIQEDPDNDVFSEVTNKVKDTGRSVYKLMMVVGAIIFVLSGLSAGILLMINKNQQGRAEVKAWLIYICLAAVIIGFILTAYGLLMNIGSSVGKSSSGIFLSNLF